MDTQKWRLVYEQIMNGSTGSTGEAIIVDKFINTYKYSEVCYNNVISWDGV